MAGDSGSYGGDWGFSPKLSGSLFSGFGGAVADLFSASGLKLKAEGTEKEAEAYDEAARLADLNVQFSKTSTEIKEAQTERTIFQTISGQQADIASAGFGNSGTALDLFRDSASQGALTKAVVSQQGLIQEASYEEQAKSYRLMSEAAHLSASASRSASTGATIGGIFKIASAGLSLFL